MMSLSEIAASVRGELKGHDAGIQGVSTDTRTLNPDELFVALRGPNFDGHAFLAVAREAGAAGALVQTEVESALATIKVPDTLQALGEWARVWRSRFTIPLIGVTGSNGKTTVKEMIGSILTVAGAPVLISAGNLNNSIGVPLMLCRLRSEHHFAVIEMGMNHPGEIAYLCRLAKPTVAVITNAGRAHLEGLGSLESVADAKGEILAGLGGRGVAVLNRDDAFFARWCELAGDSRVLSFGFDASAEVRAADYREGDNRFRLDLEGQSMAVGLPLMGRHNVANALAAAAAAYVVGIDMEQIKQGLERVRPVAGRLCARLGLRGARILDDSYNANPGSVVAGIDVLAAHSGRRVMVLGDMAELGCEAQALHEEIGSHARGQGIDVLHGYGALSEAAVRAFGPAGFHHRDRAELVACLKAEAGEHTTFLIKGSRSMRMDEVVKALAESPPAPGARH